MANKYNNFDADVLGMLGASTLGEWNPSSMGKVGNIINEIKNGDFKQESPMVVAAVVSAIASIVGGIINGKLNKGATEELQDQAWQRNEESADNADIRTRGLFNDLYSPQAKVNQLKDAGLSVGLMYGGGAAGGMSSTSGAQATSTPASFNGFDILGLMPQMINAISQSKLNEAKTKESEAKTRETDQTTQNLQEQGKLLVEQIHNEHLKGVAQEYTNTLLSIEVDIKKATKDMDIQRIEWNTRLAGYQLQEIMLKCQGDQISINQAIDLYDIILAKEGLNLVMAAEELDQFQKCKTWVIQTLKYSAMGDKENYQKMMDENSTLKRQVQEKAANASGFSKWAWGTLDYLLGLGNNVSASFVGSKANSTTTHK